MSNTKEKAIENKIKAYLKSRKIYHFKNHGNIYTEKGRPDIVGCYRGRFIAIEVKREKGGIISEAQKIHEKKILLNEGYHIYATSLDEVKDFINNIDKELDNGK